MKSQALQELVKKIFGDEKIKSEFMSNPDSVLARFNMTEVEKKAVLNMHARLGLVVSDSSQLAAVINPTSYWHAPTP